MDVIRVAFVQQGATQRTTVAPAPPAVPNIVVHTGGPSANEIREQVRQSIIDAQQATREAQAEARAAAAAGGVRTLPGGIVVRTEGRNNDIPPQAVDISIAFFLMCAVIVIGWPIARAFGKRMERGAVSPQVSSGTSEQLQRIEQAVEAMAIEIERISESQRFIAKLQSGGERAAVPLGERR